MKVKRPQKTRKTGQRRGPRRSNTGKLSSYFIRGKDVNVYAIETLEPRRGLGICVKVDCPATYRNIRNGKVVPSAGTYHRNGRVESNLLMTRELAELTFVSLAEVLYDVSIDELDEFLESSFKPIVED